MSARGHVSKALGWLLILGSLLLSVARADVPGVALTPQEREWLDRHPGMRLAVDIAWPPFEFIDSRNRYQGLAAEYVRLVEARLGIAFAVEKTLPWHQVVEAMKQRRLDIYSCVVQTPPRDAYVRFTRPYLSFPMVIVTDQRVEFVDGLEGLGGQTVAVVEGYASEDLLRENHPELNLVTTTTLQEGLAKVATGEIYAMVDNRVAIGDVIRSEGLTNLRITGQTPYRFELRMGVRSDWAPLVPILQKALDAITLQEREAIFDRWINPPDEYALNKGGQLMLVIAGAVTLALLLIWFWNRRLQLEIANRRRIEDSLRDSERRLEHAQAIAHLGSWEWDIAADRLHWSDEVYRIFGYRPQAVAASYGSFLEAIHPDDRPRVVEAIQGALDGTTAGYRVEHRVRRPDGTLCTVLEVGEVVRDPDGRGLHMSGTVQDISELKGAYERLGLAHHVIKNVSEAIVITDTQAVILDVNPAFERITGYGREEAVGQHSNLTQSGRHGADFYTRMWQTLAENGCWQGEIWDRHRNGEIFPSWLTISAIHDEAGSVSHYVGLFRDISEQKRTEAKLERLAFYDPLTGLANRALFQDRLAQELHRVERSEGHLALLFIDLDRFKYVNDSLGHGRGDQLLEQVAERLSKRVRKGDTVARVGGDEFTIIVPGFDHVDGLNHLCEALLNQLKTPFVLEGEEVFIGASIGLALYPQDGYAAPALTKAADVAMYRAKEEGGNGYCFFNPAMNQRSGQRLELERELRYALERDQLSLFYQPKVELATGRMVGVEALLRWHHPRKGLVSPLDFIPLAEETGLIVPIGAWVLREACRQAARWSRRPQGPLQMAVNLSARQFAQSQALVSGIRQALTDSGLAPGLLELELTESMVMGKVERAIDTMRTLQNLGVALAIDDFGTGYSSLEYLKKFPINTLKIDQSFVRELRVGSDDAAIVQAVIALAHGLNLEVVAEGIETAEQHRFLQQQGCRLGQGYLFSRPLPAAELEQSPLFDASADHPYHAQ